MAAPGTPVSQAKLLDCGSLLPLFWFFYFYESILNPIGFKGFDGISMSFLTMEYTAVSC